MKINKLNDSELYEIDRDFLNELRDIVSNYYHFLLINKSEETGITFKNLSETQEEVHNVLVQLDGVAMK